MPDAYRYCSHGNNRNGVSYGSIIKEVVRIAGSACNDDINSGVWE